MKFIALFTLLLSSLGNIHASELRLNYQELLKELKACRSTVRGCTIEQELEIAQFNGSITSPDDLEKILAKDAKGSKFIPLALNDEELLILAAATSLGVVAFKYDQEIMDIVQKNKTLTTERVANVGNFLGSVYGGAAIAAGTYFLGVRYKDNKLKQVGLFIVSSSAATALVSEGVKRMMSRSRPSAGRGAYDFFNPGNKSFYSGHTTEAFTIATVISEMYKEDYPVVPWVAYGVATVTAYSRMHSKAHWASDVIAGAVAGHLLTKLAMNYMRSNRDNRGGFEVTPGFTDSGTPAIFLKWSEREIEAPLKCLKLPEGTIRINACIDEALNR